MATDVSLTLPVLVTRYEYSMVSPTCKGPVFPSDAAPLLISETCGAGASVGVEVDDGFDAVGVVVPGGTPLAVAVLLTAPAATSAAVMVYGLSAVQISDSPGSSTGRGHVTGPILGSATAMALSGSSPVLVRPNRYTMVSP